MNIGFTGHRDKVAKLEDLVNIATLYPGATWVHGGAVGFDTQVENFARENNITTLIIKPNYESYGRAAPLIRNRKIVDMCSILYACYDSRQLGGTVYTINYARNRHIPVVILSTRS